MNETTENEVLREQAAPEGMDEDLIAAMQDGDDLSPEELAALTAEEAAQDNPAEEVPAAADEAAAAQPQAAPEAPEPPEAAVEVPAAELTGAETEHRTDPSIGQKANSEPYKKVENFRRDLQALRDRYPESRREDSALPAEVLQNYFSTGNLENAWLGWQQKQQSQTIASLQQEVASLRQELAAARQAPIRRGITQYGGSVSAAAEAREHRENQRTYGFDLPYW